jgi:hypothetical protein
MTDEEVFRGMFVSLEVNEDYSEAVLLLRDGSRLGLCHRVGERWVKAVVAPEGGDDAAFASQILALIAMFRLNARHLEVQFHDGSRWEAGFGDSRQAR